MKINSKISNRAWFLFPFKKVYKVIKRLRFTFDLNPNWILESIFERAKFIKCQQRQLISDLCRNSETPVNYIIGKLYCLYFTYEDFSQRILQKIENLSKNKKSLKQNWTEFKMIATIKKVRLNIDCYSDRYLSVQKMLGPETCETIVRKSSTTKRVSFKLDFKEQVQKVINSVSNESWKAKEK